MAWEGDTSTDSYQQTPNLCERGICYFITD